MKPTKKISFIAIVLSTVLIHYENAHAGENWIELQKVTHASLLRLSFLDSLLGWVVGDSGTVLRTTNGGRLWTFQDPHTTKKIVDVFFVDQRHGWALASVFPDTASPDYGTILLRTTNGGDAWLSDWYPDNIYLTLCFLDSLRGWMGGWFGKIMGTTDGGLTWFSAAIDSSSVGSMPIRRIRFFSDSVGFGVGGSIELIGVVWSTSNGGRRWKPQLAGSDPILDVYIFDSLNALGISGGFDDGASMVRTTDAGTSWEYTYIGIWGQPQAISFRTASEAWVPLGFAGTMMKTTDAGQTWQELASPDATPMYDVTFLDSATGYMVGQNGTILKYTPGSVNANEEEPENLSPSLVLHQNYPNPFNPTTLLRYAVSKSALVKLRVFDLLGQEVITLADGQVKPGRFEVVWDGRNKEGLQVGSGVYLARLEASFGKDGGSNVKFRKMLLLK